MNKEEAYLSTYLKMSRKTRNDLKKNLIKLENDLKNTPRCFQTSIEEVAMASPLSVTVVNSFKQE